MADEAATNFHTTGSGSGTKGRAHAEHTSEPTTIPAVSSIGSPPGADLTRAFQLACSRPAASTASVTPKVSSLPGITRRQPTSGAITGIGKPRFIRGDSWL